MAVNKIIDNQHKLGRFAMTKKVSLCSMHTKVSEAKTKWTRLQLLHVNCNHRLEKNKCIHTTLFPLRKILHLGCVEGLYKMMDYIFRNI